MLYCCILSAEGFFHDEESVMDSYLAGNASTIARLVVPTTSVEICDAAEPPPTPEPPFPTPEPPLPPNPPPGPPQPPPTPFPEPTPLPPPVRVYDHVLRGESGGVERVVTCMVSRCERGGAGAQ